MRATGNRFGGSPRQNGAGDAGHKAADLGADCRQRITGVYRPLCRYSGEAAQRTAVRLAGWAMIGDADAQCIAAVRFRPGLLFFVLAGTPLGTGSNGAACLTKSGSWAGMRLHSTRIG